MCRTIICIKRQKYELKRNWFRTQNFQSSCDLCAACNDKGCAVMEDFNCSEFDTDKYNVYLVKV